VEALNLGPPDYNTSALNHSATLPPVKFGNPLVFLHRGWAFSAGSNGNFDGKTERISDCRVKNSFFEKPCP